MGTTSRPITVSAAAALLTAGALSLAACRAGDDDDASLDAGARGHRARRWRRRRQPGREAGRRG